MSDNKDISLDEALRMLRKLRDSGYFEETGQLVLQLEDRLSKQQKGVQTYIEFESRSSSQELMFLHVLYTAIVNEQTIELTYLTEGIKQLQVMVFYPYMLKEYQNVWHFMGMDKETQHILVLTVDNIQDIKVIPTEVYFKLEFERRNYFHHSIGPAISPGQHVWAIVMKTSSEYAPYMKDVPFHPTQKILKELPTGLVFSVEVVWNTALEREILSYGNHLKVLAPKRFARRILARLKETVDGYAVYSNKES